MAYIGTPPGQFVIPVTLGADREFTVNRVDSNNNPVDWDAQVFITMDIDATNPTTVTATVTGNQATIILTSQICDQVKPNNTRWRLYMQVPNGAGTLTTPIAVGKFERDDG